MQTVWSRSLLGALLIVPTWPIVAGLAATVGLRIGVPPTFLLYTALLVPVLLWVATVDRLAALFGAYVLLRALPYHDTVFVMDRVAQVVNPITTAVAVVAGLALYAGARTLPADWDAPLSRTIAVVAAFTAGFQLGEWGLHWLGVPAPAGGGLGNTNYVGAFLAIAAATVPAPALVLLGLGILASQSAVGLAAFVVALALRFRVGWLAPAAVGAAVLGLLALRGWPVTWATRAAAWQWGLGHWLQAPVLGHGWGGWLAAGVVIRLPGGAEWHAQAHNEYLQLLHDGGLVAVAIVAGWLWWHGPRLRASAWGPAVAAALVDALGMFPFQIPGVACLALVCAGRATRAEVSHA